MFCSCVLLPNLLTERLNKQLNVMPETAKHNLKIVFGTILFEDFFSDTVSEECVHLWTFVPLKNLSVLGHPFLCAGTVLGSPPFQNPRAHRSNLIPSKSNGEQNTILPMRNASFRKMDGLMMAYGP